MRFQLLGPLALADGPDVVVLQPSKPVILLAALLLNANSTVSAEYLQRAVWGEDQPATAKAALQTCVLRLRRLFTKHGSPAPPSRRSPAATGSPPDPPPWTSSASATRCAGPLPSPRTRRRSCTR